MKKKINAVGILLQKIAVFFFSFFFFFNIVQYSGGKKKRTSFGVVVFDFSCTLSTNVCFLILINKFV
ncbi:hypothetical protein MIMGU_mgv1a017562mg [Erythranthe guttata]|uniref:Uncharacterized protein n=1 Tax=Erythranthe guttata TaxID=4155 RepID=A0A022RCL1_ERYGU|nr:hypothetical protein MIMGU_mgv1a017562mg [Erythranthe guttata]